MKAEKKFLIQCIWKLRSKFEQLTIHYPTELILNARTNEKF